MFVTAIRAFIYIVASCQHWNTLAIGACKLIWRTPCRNNVKLNFFMMLELSIQILKLPWIGCALDIKWHSIDKLPQFCSSLLSEHSFLLLHLAESGTHWRLEHVNWFEVHPVYISHTEFPCIEIGRFYFHLWYNDSKSTAFLFITPISAISHRVTSCRDGDTLAIGTRELVRHTSW